METEIGEIHLSSTGLNQQQAHDLATLMAEHIHAGLPALQRHVHVPELRIKIMQQQPAGVEQTARQIAEQVLQKLQLHHY